MNSQPQEKIGLSEITEKRCAVLNSVRVESRWVLVTKESVMWKFATMTKVMTPIDRIDRSSTRALDTQVEPQATHRVVLASFTVDFCVQYINLS